VSGQRGQAIVGVLVIMTLVFLLAGAVAIGTSTLLTRLRGPAITVESDLTARSAAAAAAAGALNGATTGKCQPQAPVQAQRTVAPAPVNFSLPASNGGHASPQRAYCVAMQQVSGALNRVVIRPTGSCTKTGIGSPSTDLWIFVAARWLRSGGAYVASMTDRCLAAAPTTSPCSTVIPNATDPAIPVAMSCPIHGTVDAALFVYGATAAFTAYLAAQDSGSGSGRYYLAVAGTGLARPADVEQVLLFQPTSGNSSPQVRLEGPLP
jgi:hypothetical protein